MSYLKFFCTEEIVDKFPQCRQEFIVGSTQGSCRKDHQQRIHSTQSTHFENLFPT